MGHSSWLQSILAAVVEGWQCWHEKKWLRCAIPPDVRGGVIHPQLYHFCGIYLIYIYIHIYTYIYMLTPPKIYFLRPFDPSVCPKFYQKAFSTIKKKKQKKQKQTKQNMSFHRNCIPQITDILLHCIVFRKPSFIDNACAGPSSVQSFGSEHSCRCHPVNVIWTWPTSTLLSWIASTGRMGSMMVLSPSRKLLCMSTVWNSTDHWPNHWSQTVHVNGLKLKGPLTKPLKSAFVASWIWDT